MLKINLQLFDNQFSEKMVEIISCCGPREIGEECKPGQWIMHVLLYLSDKRHRNGAKLKAEILGLVPN